MDAPRVLKLPNGHYDFNDPAFKAVDLEMKRLQQVERVHNQEPPWATPVLIGMGLGILAGLAIGVPVGVWAKSALDAGK